MHTLVLDLNGVLHDPATCTPIPGSQWAISILASRYNIHIATFAPFRETVAEFVKQYFPQINVENIHCVSNKGQVLGDIIIDDDGFNLDDSQCQIKILFGGKNENYTCFDNWYCVVLFLLSQGG